MPKLDFKALLNAEQLAAATAPDGPILVLAAAGTGKTRTLVFRVAYLVERGIDPRRILLLTFTNKAAREMLARAHEVAGDSVSGVWGGTFHHMANRLLRRHAGRVGFAPDYTILDRDDSRTLVSQCVKNLKLGGGEFPKAAVLLGLFSSAANTEGDVGELAAERFLDVPVDAADIVKVHDAYVARKVEVGGLDFDDLLVKCLTLFREHDDVSAEYRDRFQHVLVDEYQDTNTIQAELVDRIAAGSRNVLVVGDDFQSIYSWRGADYRNIMSFPERYPDAQTVMLETNYRSVPEILNVANACIAGNPDQFQKVLRPTREAYEKPSVARVRDGEEQARFIVERIRQLKRDGYPLSQIAILYRAHYHALDLERLLPRVHIPYEITSGVRFFEQAHIKDVCSLLRVIMFPSDELAFTRLLGLLPGIGVRTADKLWKLVDRHFDARNVEQRRLIVGAMPTKARPRWEAIDGLFDALEGDAESIDGEHVIVQFVAQFYETYLVNTYENFEQRLDDVQALASDVTKFDSVEGFLSDVALLTNVDGEDDDIAEPGESVRLSTVHQAKGLEWSVVFILWATEGMFPSSRTLQESDEGDAEERRLFYVAVTRAKDELCICVPEIRRMRDGGIMYCAPSRFVEEISSDLVRAEHVGFV